MEEAVVQRDIADGLGIDGVTCRSGAPNWSRYDGIVDTLLGTARPGCRGILVGGRR